MKRHQSRYPWGSMPPGRGSARLFRPYRGSGWINPWLYIGLAIATAASKPHPSAGGRGLVVAALLAGELGCVALFLWWQQRSRRIVGAPLVGMIVFSVVLHAYNPHSPALAFAYLACWVGVWVVPLWQSAALPFIGIAGFGLLIWLGVMPHTQLYGQALGMLGIVVASYALRQRRTARAEARTAQQAQESEAALAERTRIAREIHDILAHSLSAQLVHLEAARLLLARGETDHSALDRVEQAQRLARTGLEETKRALSALRGDAPPLGDALRTLGEEFEAASGQPCEVLVTGTERRLSAATGLAIARTAQEALANVRTHAPGAGAEVELNYAVRDACELRVVNKLTEDPSPAAETSGAGYGLVGMRERAELLGGSLAAAADGGEFRVLLRVPA